MTACTSFLAFFAEQTLAFAEKMHSRPDRWPLEAAKRLEARAHAVRSAGTLGRLRRHSAKTSDRVILVDKPKVCQRSESASLTAPLDAKGSLLARRSRDGGIGKPKGRRAKLRRPFGRANPLEKRKKVAALSRRQRSTGFRCAWPFSAKRWYPPRFRGTGARYSPERGRPWRGRNWRCR